MAKPTPEPPMDTATALDLARSFHGRIVKPFERLTDVLQAAADAESTITAARAEAVRLKKETALAQEYLDGLRADIAQAEQEDRDTRTRIKASLAEIKDGLDAARAAKDHATAAVAAELAEKRAAAQAEFDSWKAGLDQEIKGLTGTRDALVAELGRLRSRFAE